MNETAVLWCLAHQSNFFKSTFTSLIKTTLGGIQQLQRTCRSAHPPRACFDSSVWIAIEVLILLPLSNIQEFPFLNFQNILFLFEACNSYTRTMYVYTYMGTRAYMYKYRYMTIYAWGLRSQFVKVPHRIWDMNTQAVTQLKSRLTNSLQPDMQFLCFFLGE